MGQKTISLFLALALLSSFSFLSAADLPREAGSHFDKACRTAEKARSRKDFLKAANEMEKARKLAPDRAIIYYYLGIYQEKAGCLKDALASLQKYRELPFDPDHIVTHIDKTIARIQEKKDRLDRKLVYLCETEYTSPSFKRRFKALLQEGADVDARDDFGNTLLMDAVESEWPDLIRALLDQGADVNARQGDGGTILARAVFIGKFPKVVKWLIEKGADVNACNTGGFTPLMYPPLYHQEEILRMLLDKGADVNARTETGLTPLFFWASAKNSEAMKLLFDRGADINAKDIEGGTALIRANITDPAVIKLFLDRGADLSVRDRRGATALSQTIKSGRKEIAELLKAAGAKE